MPLVPKVVEQTKGGRKAYDIFSKLLDERIIFVAGPVTDSLANLLIAEILLLASQDPEQDIQLYINTPGGSVTAGLGVYDTMQYVDCDISTVAIGMAGSMGAVLLAAGTEGKRMALPNSQILLHQVAGGVKGEASKIEITANQIAKIKKKINEILAKHTGQPLEKVQEDTDRDFYLGAEEAKEYGIVDKVIEGKVSE